MPNVLPPPSGRYIDPLDDYAFKRIFGSEPNKDLLIHFLNQVFRGRKTITDLTYGKNEHSGTTGTEGGVVFDLYCTGPGGEQFIIEVQRGSQQYFRERAVFYTSRLISQQAPRGKRRQWNYELQEVYLVALLERFSVQPEPGGSHDYLYDVCLCNRATGELFYDKLNYTYIELRHFTKNATELHTDLDRWLYVLKHLSHMNKLPAFLRKPIFTKLFQIAEYNNMTKQERIQYDRAQMHRWDEKNVRDFAIKEAREQAAKQAAEEAIQQAKREERIKIEAIAANLKHLGIAIVDIASATGLPEEDIRLL